MSDSIIEATELTKIYQTGGTKTAALNGVSFDIAGGEFVAIMGPSGSGKSTLMHILGALDLPTNGSYTLDGDDISELDEEELARIRNLKIGFIFQAFNLLPRVTALKNVMVPMMYAGVPRAERLERAKKYLEMVGLGDKLESTSSQLSGGEQQRVAIARGISMSPSILLADEPTGNLATSQSSEVMEIFHNLHGAGHTVVMITHEPEIAAYAKRIISLRDGKIIDDREN